MDNQRYVNTLNGVYDTVEKRIVYGKPPVKYDSADSSKPDGTNEHSSVEDEGSEGKIIISADALSDKIIGELPTDYLMPKVAELVYKASYVMDCSPDIVLSTMFAVVSGAVGTKIKVFDGKYTNMLNINVCHVAPPGSNKTQPVGLFVKPLEQISMRIDAAYKEELKRYRKDKENQDKPNPQILYVSNPTPESINKMMAYNPHGLFARRDELAGFIDDLGGRYSNGNGGIPDFLSIFTNEYISIIRVGEEPLIIQKPYLTVVGGIQPARLTKVLGTEQLIYSGFNYRWLFVVPEIKISVERNMLGIPQSDLNYWEMLIEKFHNIRPMTLTFDDEAQLKLNDYFREIRLKKIEGDDCYMDEVRDKLFIYLEKWAALATLLHGDNVEYFEGLPKEQMGNTFESCMPCMPVITAQAVEYSIECMHVFEGWAKKVRDMLPANGNNRSMTIGDAIRTINSVHPITNKTKFAECLGISRQMLHRYLPKADNEIESTTINPEFTPENAGNSAV